jgi:prepilin-type N-terminal cleavage/methylation domain-containing protein
MVARHAVSLVEIIVVLAIIAVLLGLLLPAVQASRERARESVCKNNLHQLNTALAHYAEAQRKLPPANAADMMGGWAIEILPYLEESNLEREIPRGVAIAAAPAGLREPPVIFQCPVRAALDDPSSLEMRPAHYVFVPQGGRESFELYDAPLQLTVPWAASPELTSNEIQRQTGPHHDGYFRARGFQQGIDFVSSE